MQEFLTSTEAMVMVSMFSLSWLIVGILLGQRTVSNEYAPKSRKRGGKRIEMYIGNLSYETREKDLAKAFEAHGEVLSCRIIKNRLNGKSKGYGFVEMGDPDEVAAAVRALNGKDLHGRRIVVNEAKSRSRQ